MNTRDIIAKVQAELERLGLTASEYNITEINGEDTLTFDHTTKTVRVGSAPSISFLVDEPVVPSFMGEEAVPNFF